MKIKDQLKLQKDIEVPWHVWSKFGSKSKIVSISGNQASLGEDYGTIQELRAAIEWYAEQLGGKIRWKDE